MIFNIIRKCVLRETKIFRTRSFRNCKTNVLIDRTSQFLAITTNRNVYTGRVLNVRAFRDSENVYAYDIIKAMPLVSTQYTCESTNDNILSLEEFETTLDQEWRLKSGAEIVDAFQRVVSYCSTHNVDLSDRRFDKLTDGLMDHIQDLTDMQLLNLINCVSAFPPTDSYSSHNFHDIWSALDDVCCWKAPNWPKETLFLFAEGWYKLNLGKIVFGKQHYLTPCYFRKTK